MIEGPVFSHDGPVNDITIRDKEVHERKNEIIKMAVTIFDINMLSRVVIKHVHENATSTHI